MRESAGYPEEQHSLSRSLGKRKGPGVCGRYQEKGGVSCGWHGGTVENDKIHLDCWHDCKERGFVLEGLGVSEAFSLRKNLVRFKIEQSLEYGWHHPAHHSLLLLHSTLT